MMTIDNQSSFSILFFSQKKDHTHIDERNAHNKRKKKGTKKERRAIELEERDINNGLA
jgi:hypothetical protein